MFYVYFLTYTALGEPSANTFFLYIHVIIGDTEPTYDAVTENYIPSYTITIYIVFMYLGNKYLLNMYYGQRTDLSTFHMLGLQ